MQKQPFPLSGLLALALSGFLAIMTETLPAGLLPAIAQSLDVDTGAAGQLVTVYALGSILAAIPVIGATKSWSRKRLFVVAIAGFFIFNTLTAWSPVYWLTMGARFAVGVAAGVVWGMLAGYARRMVPANQAGRAMAIALVGTPVALSFGVPAGTWLGGLVGWHAVFGVMSVYAAALLVFVWRVLPDFPGSRGDNSVTYSAVWRTRGVRPLLLVTLLWLGAHNIFYTYIAPFLATRHIKPVDLVLLAFGVAALVAIVLTGLWIDRHLRRLALWSVSGFLVAAVGLAVLTNAAATVALIALWGLSFGGAATILQTSLGQRVADSALDLVMSLNATVWNVSIAGAGVIGGLLVQSGRVALIPWLVAGMALVALWIVVCHVGDHGEE